MFADCPGGLLPNNFEHFLLGRSIRPWLEWPPTFGGRADVLRVDQLA